MSFAASKAGIKKRPASRAPKENQEPEPVELTDE